MSLSSPLASCVSSLQSSMQLLDSSISILDDGVNDYPRLSKVLQTARVCLSLPYHLELDRDMIIADTGTDAP